MSPFGRSALLLLVACLPAFSLPAFPGAEGWGAETVGGRGTDPKTKPPKVYVVTTLASSGKGSFNEAFQATGPRIITFAVSGVIDLQPTGTMNQFLPTSENNYVTIAGQTSPGGITLVSGGDATSIIFSYESGFKEIIIRFVRFRAREHNEDGLTFSRVGNFILDHCDFSGARDETLDLSSCRDYTVQWSTITNSSKGQTYGMLLANYSDGYHISLHHNLIAHHIYRFPEFHWSGGKITDSARVDYRNNVCYNGENYFIMAGQNDTPDRSVRFNLVGNTFKAGPQSPPNAESEAAWFTSMNHIDDHIIAYESDNVMIPKSGAKDRNALNKRIANKASAPQTMPAITTQSADDAYELVLDKVGAWPRDAMNTRTVGEVRAGTGQFRKDNDALIASGPAAPADADQDGMADAWETAMGLNPASAADNVLDQDDDGYLNIEEYINDVALARLGEPLQNPKGANSIGAGVASRGNFRGDYRLTGREARGGALEIRLPPGARAEGSIVITDSRGRRLADLPAKAVTVWRHGKAGGLASGLYTVSWIVGGRVVLSEALASD